MRTDIAPVTDRAAFLEEWTRLYAISEPNFFLSPAWIGALMDAAGPRARLSALRAFDDLRGVFALALISGPGAAPFPAPREMRVNESGIDALDRVTIEYNDVLAARAAPDGVRESMLAALLASAGDADQIIFRNARARIAPLVTAAASEAGFSVDILSDQPTYRINLQDGGAIIDRLSPSLRAKIRRSIRRYEERGAVEIFRPESAEERAVAWTELLRLHAETWSRRGVKGAFENVAMRAFHSTLIEKHPDKTDFVRLRAGGETIGVLYNFIERGLVMNYQSGFRYAADNQLAPGFVAHSMAADAYRAAGFGAYDLLAGDAGYKRRLGAPGERLVTLSLTRATMRMRARSMMKSLFAPHRADARQT